MAIDRIECGRRIKAARLAAGLTIDQAAASLSVHRSSYTQYETGRRVPSWVTLYELIDGLGLDPKILFPEFAP